MSSIPSTTEGELIIKKIMKALYLCTEDVVVYRVYRGVLPLLENYTFKNGLAMIVESVTAMIQLSKELDTTLRINANELEELFHTGWTSFLRNHPDQVDLTFLTDKSLSPSIPTELEEIGQLLFDDFLAEWEDIMLIEDIVFEDIPALIVNLKATIKSEVSKFFLRLQSEALVKTIKIGRKEYYGPDSLGEIGSIMAAKISNINNSQIDIKTITSLADEEMLEGDNKYEFLCKFNIPPLDEMGGLRTNYIISIPAREGTGKTRMSAFFYDVFSSQGVRVAIAGSESGGRKIPCMIRSHAFLRKYDKQVTWLEMAKPRDIAEDNLRSEVALFNSSFFTTEYPIDFMKNLTVSNFKDTIVEYYALGCKVFIIDNPASIPLGGWKSYSRESAGADKSKLDHLGDIMVDLKRDYPISFVCTYWTKDDGEIPLRDIPKLLTQTRTVSGTANISKYSDCMVEMGGSPDLAKRLRIIMVKKWREYQVVQPAFILDTKLAAQHFSYEPELQYLLGD